MFLFDVGEEGGVAEVGLAAGADVGTVFTVILLTVEHGITQN
jgi:hypothetical protein